MSDLVKAVRDLQSLLTVEYSMSPGMFQEIARLESLLAETYRNRVQYELLQNSDDAQSTSVQIRQGRDGSVIWTNDGRSLSADDVEALCRSASSTKKRGESIGYRGIGFKSMAALARRIEVQSAGVHFAFEREATRNLLDGHTGKHVGHDLPLIRVPSDIKESGAVMGVSFRIVPKVVIEPAAFRIDPTALLFLRNVQVVRSNLRGAGEIRAIRDHDRSVISVDGVQADFGMRVSGSTSVAIPLNPSALRLAGTRGRLSCFLPLSDHPGLPIVVSGDLLTDPSRTHAVVEDESTQSALAVAARLVASILRDPDDALFERMWDLALSAEDARAILMSTPISAGSIFMIALQEELRAQPPPFAYSTVPIEAADLHQFFPGGAPTALYNRDNLAAARSLKSVLGLPTLDLAQCIEAIDLAKLSPETKAAWAAHLQDQARAQGRPLSEAEKTLGISHGQMPQIVPVPALIRVEETNGLASMPQLLARWRAAEVTVQKWLNQRGWDLEDVSTQNLGYDLSGTDSDGEKAYIEVKKVDRPDGRFSMTNNEMSLMQSGSSQYLIAIVVGDNSQARLMMLNPAEVDLPRERVCRRWDWEFTDWSTRGTYLI